MHLNHPRPFLLIAHPTFLPCTQRNNPAPLELGAPRLWWTICAYVAWFAKEAYFSAGWIISAKVAPDNKGRDRSCGRVNKGKKMPAESKAQNKGFWNRHFSVESLFGGRGVHHSPSKARCTLKSHRSQDSSSWTHEGSSTNSKNISPSYTEKDNSSFNLEEKVAELAKINDALVEEIANLRSNETTWSTKAKQLEEKVHSNLIRIDDWLKESKGLRSVMVTVEQSTKHKNDEDIGMAENINVLWQTEKLALENEKYDLQISLSESKRALQDVNELVKKMETAANDANAKVSELECQLEKLRGDNKLLRDTKILLQAQRKNQEVELRDLESRKQEQDVELRNLKSQRDALKRELQKLTEAFDMALDGNSRAEQEIQVTRDELLRANDDNNTLRKLWADASERSSNLERQNEDLKSNLEEVGVLLQLALEEINSVGKEHEKVLSELQQERTLKDSMMGEIKLLEAQITDAEQELASLKSLISKMEENAVLLEQQSSHLQNQVAKLSQERSRLEGTVSETEAHVQKLTANSVKTLGQAEEEVEKLKQNVEDLEDVLAKVKGSGSFNESNVSKLLEEVEFSKALLQRQAKIIKVALPTASVSICTLVAISIFALLRLYKHKRN